MSICLLSAADWMNGKKELTFLKAHLGELFQAVL
jgi:hypothetical protein